MSQKTLIAYFSHSNNTMAVANKIKDFTAGSLFQITTVAPYSVDYDACVKQAKNEQKAKARPTLSTNLDSIAEYDTIFLGFPNWWGTMPMALWTFLESHDFTGKTILPFCTHEGSGMGRSEGDIKKLCPDAIVKEGLPLRGSTAKTAQKAVEKWLAVNSVK